MNMILTFMLLLASASGWTQQVNMNRIYLEQMVIIGNSNISGIKLSFRSDHLSKNQLVSGVIEDGMVVFYIPVDNITAKNRLMLNDFRDLIHADNFPYIKLAISNEQMINLTNKHFSECINVDVTLAGLSKTYHIPFYKNCSNDNSSYITGNADLYLSDFNIYPDKKIFGLLKLDNKVFINFKINFAET